MDCDTARKNAAQFLSLTSLYPYEFDILLSRFIKEKERKAEADEKSRAHPRKRAEGAGRPKKLKDPASELFFILCYMKNYVTQQFSANGNGACQSTISVWVRKYTELLANALGDDFLPSKNPDDIKKQIEKFRSVNENSQNAQDEPVIIDATERQIPRPVDNETQKIYYSGKAKRHTLKTVVVVLVGVIIGLSECVEGKRHDKRVTQEQNYKFPEGTNVLADLGMVGLMLYLSNLKLPHKKPKGGKLTEIQTIENKAISSVRVAVEHAIRCIKRMHIAKSILRSKWEGMDDLSLRVPAGLHNFRHSLRCPTSWN